MNVESIVRKTETSKKNYSQFRLPSDYQLPDYDEKHVMKKAPKCREIIIVH